MESARTLAPAARASRLRPMTVILILFAAGAVLLLAVAWGLRRYVCFRRKDCCGKGCGCLFPIKR